MEKKDVVVVADQSEGMSLLLKNQKNFIKLSINYNFSA